MYLAGLGWAWVGETDQLAESGSLQPNSTQHAVDDINRHLSGLGPLAQAN